MGLMLHSEMPSPKRVLHSWKEIATYTGRGVRTVQRYELQYGFPVRRPAGGPRSAVLALCGEIDEWLAHSPKRPDLDPPHHDHGTKNGNGNALSAALCEQISSAHRRSEMVRHRAESMIESLERAKLLCARLNASWQHTMELREKIIATTPSVTRSRKAAAASIDPLRN